MPHRYRKGLSLIEFIIVIGVLFILTILFIPHMFAPGSLKKAQMTQTLSNMRQLHLATRLMAEDGIAKTNWDLGWPGDTGGTFGHWARHLVPTYLSTNDFGKLLSVPGLTLNSSKLPLTNYTGILVYAVSSNSPPTTVFLSTANFTNSPSGGNTLDPKAKPYGERGFVVFRKDGAGTVLKPQVVGMTNAIGAYAPLCE